MENIEIARGEISASCIWSHHRTPVGYVRNITDKITTSVVSMTFIYQKVAVVPNFLATGVPT